MYHFTADHPPEPVRLSFRALIPGHIRQYLKDFQLDAVRFMHNYLAKGEFCVYNDESGLGKQAAVVVLLDAACSSRKCLIVVQNDDRYITGWEFHFNILTNTNVTIIKDERDTTDSPHSIYIAKWSTLRTIDDLSKLKFDFIILDNRGQMLNNSFCTSMLLKHYEHKISILISSVDITSDLKLLHNVLRLGGRLEPKYASFKIFEEKFKLPDAKELAYKRVDLEEYFCKRERLADYCKVFRIRRYCHQFETQLPLVKEDRYKINLNLWREKQNATNSESSSVEFLNTQNREDEQIKDTQELFEEYCRQRRKQHLQFQHEEEQRLQQREREMLKNLGGENDVIYNVDDEVALINDTPPQTVEKLPVVRDNSDEPILMSPLLVESDSDTDDIPELCNDQVANIEIVDLSSEDKIGEAQKQNDETSLANDNSNEAVKKFPKRQSNKKQYELIRLEENIVDSLKIKPLSTRSLRNKNEVNKKLRENNMHEKNSKNKRLNKVKTSTKNTRESNISVKGESNPTENNTKESKSNLVKSFKENRIDSIKRSETKLNQCKNNTEILNDKNTSSNSKTVHKGICKIIDDGNKTETNVVTTPVTSRKTRFIQNVDNIVKKSSAKINENQSKIKQEVLAETPHAEKNRSHTPQKVNNEILRVKRKINTLTPCIPLKQTRSMQRLTRSASRSKYFVKNLSLQIEKIKKPKRNTFRKEASESVRKNKNEDDAKQSETIVNKKEVKCNTKSAVENTQTSIISHRSSQDYESLQCAQRLSAEGAFDNGVEKTNFLVPPTPNIILRNSLIPSSLTSSAGFLTESDILLLPPANPNTATNKKHDQVVLLSSSDNDNSTSQSSSTNVSMTSRRTRALKPKRKHQKRIVDETSKVPTFSELLIHQNTRSSAKSPDLFSNCSDLIQLPCTQPSLNSEEPNTPFEGFKIFGSEVKQLQQHYAFNKNNNILSRQNENLKKSYRAQRSCLDILEKMFEPSNKKSKPLANEAPPNPTKSSSRLAAAANKHKRQTQILPSHPIEAIAEARQQQEVQKRKRSITTSSSALRDDDIFEITNNGTFGSVMRLHSNGDISPVQTQKTNAKQHNKITNYLIGNAIQNCSQEQTTPNSGNSACNFSTEAGTPSKRHQQLSAVQNVNVKKSPKGKCNVTQTTKLTKWFTKPSNLNSHEKALNTKKTTAKNQQPSQEVSDSITAPPAVGKRILKRRRLVLSFNK